MNPISGKVPDMREICIAYGGQRRFWPSVKGVKLADWSVLRLEKIHAILHLLMLVMLRIGSVGRFGSHAHAHHSHT